MPTETAQSGTRRNLVWRAVQLPVSIFFRLWAPLSVEGIEKLREGPGLLIANHQSYLDPLILAVRLSRPVSYVARDSLFRIPLVGWILRRTYVTPISRTATRAATIRASLQRLEEGFLVGVFPEGTRSSDEIQPFRPGVGAILKRADVPVYPVGIAGANRAMPRGSLLVRPRRIKVVFGDPIPPEDLKRLSGERSGLIEHVRDRVVDVFRTAEEGLTAKPISGSKVSAENS